MNKVRFLELEGIRGLAAVSVIIFHIILIFYPRIAYGNDSDVITSHLWIEDFLHGNPLNFMFSGLFAVALFFVLSGFVLSIGFFNGDGSIVRKLASRRYLRLMLPALCSIIIAYILIKLGLSEYREQAARIIGGGSLFVQWNFDPNFFNAFIQGIWSIFATGEDTYNRVLWTMHYEFFGSLLVFMLIFIFGNSKYRMVVFLLVLLLSTGSWYMGFILGLILADIYRNKNKYLNIFRNTPVGVGVLLLGFFLGSFPLQGVQNTFYGAFYLNGLSIIQNITIFLSIGAFLVILVAISNPIVKRILSTPKLAILGKYTFSMYLTHMLVLLTLTPFLFTAFHPLVGYNKAVAFAVVLSVPVIVCAAWVFEIYIDRPSIKFSNHVSKIIDNGEYETTNSVKEKSKTLLILRKLIDIPK